MLDIHAIQAAAYRVSYDGAVFRFDDSNAACLAMTGVSAAFQPGLCPHDIFSPEVAEDVVRRYRACLAGEAISYETSATVGGQPRLWRTTLFSAGAGTSDAAIYGICCPADGLLHDGDLPSLVLDMLDGGYWTLDLPTREFKTSRRLAEKLAGPGHTSLDLAEYVGYVHAEDLTLEMPDGDDEVVVEFRVFTYEGRMRWFRTRRRPVRNDTGRTTRVVGVVLDITDEKMAILRLQEEAVTDNLTAIGNRRAFDRTATHRFGDEAAGGVGLVLIDLDGFKPVNDRYGHSAGDALLREVAERLKRIATPGDLLARIGGDEFAIIVSNATCEGMAALVGHVDDWLVTPFDVAGQAIAVSASCGSAVRISSDRSIGDIIARADRALYAAKAARKTIQELLTA